jgi:hypothetical protein
MLATLQVFSGLLSRLFSQVSRQNIPKWNDSIGNSAVEQQNSRHANQSGLASRPRFSVLMPPRNKLPGWFKTKAAMPVFKRSFAVLKTS